MEEFLMEWSSSQEQEMSVKDTERTLEYQLVDKFLLKDSQTISMRILFMDTSDL